VFALANTDGKGMLAARQPVELGPGKHKISVELKDRSSQNNAGAVILVAGITLGGAVVALTYSSDCKVGAPCASSRSAGLALGSVIGLASLGIGIPLLAIPSRATLTEYQFQAQDARPVQHWLPSISFFALPAQHARLTPDGLSASWRF
jgi:hypothetical protein